MFLLITGLPALPLIWPYNRNIVFRHLWVKGRHGTVTPDKSEWFLIFFFPSTILLRPCRNNYERSKETVFYQHICVCHSGQINTNVVFPEQKPEEALQWPLVPFSWCCLPNPAKHTNENFLEGLETAQRLPRTQKPALRNITGQFKLFNLSFLVILKVI